MLAKRSILLSFLFLCAVCPLLGAQLAFSNPERIENAGVVMPSPMGFEQAPLKSPEVLVYQFTRGEESWTEERLHVIDMWIASQHIAGWQDDRGGIVTLARMTTILPNDLIEQDVSRENYPALSEEYGYVPGAVNLKEDLTVWIKNYTGLSFVGEPMSLQINRSRLADLFEFPTGNSGLRVYAFRFNKRFPGQANAPECWFCIYISVSETPGPGFDRSIRSGLLSKLSGFGGRTVPAAFKSTKNRSGENAGKWSDPVRDSIHESVAYLDDWWYMDSENYVMLSNDGGAETKAADVLEMLESSRKNFSAVVAFPQNATSGPGVVRLFASDEEYERYILEDGADASVAEWSAGVFSGRRRELVIRPIKAKGTSVDQVIRHEAFHQYLFNALGGEETSPWFNEGLAIFFEGMRTDSRGKCDIREVRAYSEWIQKELRRRDVNWEERLQALLYADYPAFYSAPASSYPLAYSFMYYLLRGAPLERGSPYAGIIPGYLSALQQTGSPNHATEAAFSKIDMKRLTRDFRNFWLSSKSRRDAISEPFGN